VRGGAHRKKKKRPSGEAVALRKEKKKTKRNETEKRGERKGGTLSAIEGRAE